MHTDGDAGSAIISALQVGKKNEFPNAEPGTAWGTAIPCSAKTSLTNVLGGQTPRSYRLFRYYIYRAASWLARFFISLE
jgi:hypothetical protein